MAECGNLGDLNRGALGVPDAILAASRRSRKVATTKGKPETARFEVTGKDGAALRGFYSDLCAWQIQEGAKGSGLRPGPGGRESDQRHHRPTMTEFRAT
jgi:hypothetical protein